MLKRRLLVKVLTVAMGLICSKGAIGQTATGTTGGVDYGNVNWGHSSRFAIPEVTTTNGFSSANITNSIDFGTSVWNVNDAANRGTLDTLFPVWADYTAQTVKVKQGGTFNLAVRIKDTYPSGWCGGKVWIDWNHDGDFTDAGEEIGSMAATGDNTYNFTVTAPVDATIANTRMRIRVLDAGGGLTVCDPTGSNTHAGTGQDFVVDVRSSDEVDYGSVSWGHSSRFAITGVSTTNGLDSVNIANSIDPGSNNWSDPTGKENLDTIFPVWSDYTATSVKVKQGTSFDLAVTIKDTYPSGWCGGKVWIDWNHDGDFIDAGEEIGTMAATGNNTYNFTVTAPAGAAVATTRMRIRVLDAGGTGLDNCDPAGTNTNVGTGQDYAVQVILDDATPVIGLQSDLVDNVLSWSVDNEAAVAEYVVETFSNGNWQKVTVVEAGSMQYSVTVTDQNAQFRIKVVDTTGFVQHFSAGGQKRLTLSLKAGWNLVSSPFENAKIAGAGNELSLWGWNGESYQVVDKPKALEGFWIYSPEDKEIIVTGEIVSNPDVVLAKGWNLYGPAENCIVPTDILVYCWDKSYQNVIDESQILVQGKGYWFFSDKERIFTLK